MNYKKLFIVWSVGTVVSTALLRKSSEKAIAEEPDRFARIPPAQRAFVIVFAASLWPIWFLALPANVMRQSYRHITNQCDCVEDEQPSDA